MQTYWPLILIVVSNIVYHVCSKSVPDALNPFAALTVTYLVGALASGVLFFALNPGQSLVQAYKELNWTAIALGVAIVGLEAGTLYMYKLGWEISVGQLVHSGALAVCLLIIGRIFYNEPLTATKIIGAVVCLGGLVLLNI